MVLWAPWRPSAHSQAPRGARSTSAVAVRPRSELDSSFISCGLDPHTSLILRTLLAND